jgi:hypothetical protein
MTRQNLFRVWMVVTIGYWVTAGLYEIFHVHQGAHPWIQAGLGLIVALGLPSAVLVVGHAAFRLVERFRAPRTN